MQYISTLLHGVGMRLLDCSPKLAMIIFPLLVERKNLKKHPKTPKFFHTSQTTYYVDPNE